MGKVIVISGGSDGFGKEVARLLSKDHTVVILANNELKLKAAATELRCDYVVCDVTDYASIEKAVEEITARYPAIDCLLNNAGVWIQGKIVDNDTATIQKAVNVNLLGAIFLAKAVAEKMLSQKSGLILNTISQAGLYGKAERSVYTATKFGLSGFTKSLQPELSPLGIRVTGLYPGKMKTNLFKNAGVEKSMEDGLDPAVAARTVEFLLSLPEDTLVPELGIKSLYST